MEQEPEAKETRAPALRAALGFVLVTTFLDGVSFGLIFPILPQLVVELSGGDAQDAARAFGWMAAGWAFMNLFGAPLLGALSDRFGRRPVLLISSAGFAVDLLFMALAPTLPWLFVGRALSGLTAGGYAAASAYIADISPPDQRARRFGYFGAVSGVGLILGPAMGGFLGEVNSRAPFYAAAGCMALCWLYGLFVLPESLPRELRTSFDWRRANPLGSLGLLARDKALLGLATVGFLGFLGANAANTLFVLYTTVRYHWAPAQNGLLLMVYSGGTILVMGLIAPRMVRAFGERATVLSGLALAVVGFAGLGLAPSAAAFCLACAPTCLSNMWGPPNQALQTRRVQPTEYGRLQGAVAGLTALGGLVAPVFFTQVFAWSSGSEARGGPGLPLLIGAALLAAALVLALFVAKPPPPGSPA